MKKLCSTCGKSLPDGAAFCPHCGTRLDAPCECVVCGTMVPFGVDLCPTCGNSMKDEGTASLPPLPPSPSSLPSPPTPPPVSPAQSAPPVSYDVREPRDKKSMVWRWILFAVIVTGLAFFAFLKLFWLAVEPEAAAVAPMEYVQPSDRGVYHREPDIAKASTEGRYEMRGVFIDENDYGKEYPISLTYDVINHHIDEMTYTNRAYGGSIKMKVVERNERQLKLEGMDGKKTFTIQINPSGEMPRYGTVVDGEMRLLVRIDSETKIDE